MATLAQLKDLAFLETRPQAMQQSTEVDLSTRELVPVFLLYKFRSTLHLHSQTWVFGVFIGHRLLAIIIGDLIFIYKFSKKELFKLNHAK